MRKATALIIFIKNPVEGKVKTRLATDIGGQAALRVYLKLLDITKKAAIDCNLDCYLFYDNNVVPDDDWSNDHFIKRIQEGSDLGERMNNAFNLALSSYKSAIIIGSDCPDISANIILQAKDTLQKKDTVIGPSLDGGYYLLGMNSLTSELFNDIKWSTDSVLSSTLDIIKKMGLTVHQLSPLRDIDTINDLKFYPELMPEY